MGGGYVAPRPGCPFHGGKNARYGDIFPGKYPFRPPARKFPPRPVVLLSSTQPRVDFRPGKIKAPEESPGLGFWVVD